MQASFVALILVLADTGPVQKAAPTPPVLSVPIPIGAPSPDTGLILLSGYRSGHAGGLRSGAGWRFKDGSTFLISLGRRPIPVELNYWRPVYVTENVRWSLVAGTNVGTLLELYLGHGVSTQIEVGGFLPQARLAICFYPCEGVCLTMGCDHSGGFLDCAWILEQESLP